MKEFFNVTDLDQVLSYRSLFDPVETEQTDICESTGRILAEDIYSGEDIPDFDRSVMDGYAVKASSTFGASEGTPAYLEVRGSVLMGEQPSFSIGPGEAARISTGGMLPVGTNAVVMAEYTDILDEGTIEVYKSVAPGQNVILKGEDFKKDRIVLSRGSLIRPQESGLLAALGKSQILLYKKPVVGIISTGDEIVEITEVPMPGKIRDINSYTLLGQILESGGVPIFFGIVRDDYQLLQKKCEEALEISDMVLISGGSSVGVRDFTINVLSSLPSAKILAHGIPISPGKPTILAQSKNKQIWGLPGHVVSTMVVFTTVVNPFLAKISGCTENRGQNFFYKARLTRNIASAQGRVEYVRVHLKQKDGNLWAEPVLGKSGLLHTMVLADGLVAVDMNCEGLDKGTEVTVIPI